MSRKSRRYCRYIVRLSNDSRDDLSRYIGDCFMKYRRQYQQKIVSTTHLLFEEFFAVRSVRNSSRSRPSLIMTTRLNRRCQPHQPIRPNYRDWVISEDVASKIAIGRTDWPMRKICHITGKNARSHWSSVLWVTRDVFETIFPLFTQKVHKKTTPEKYRQYRRSDRDLSAIYRISAIIGKSEAISSTWVSSGNVKSHLRRWALSWRQAMWRSWYLKGFLGRRLLMRHFKWSKFVIRRRSAIISNATRIWALSLVFS